ncbi:MAG: glycosyl transferase family 90 [Gammaproteobacteria bacterium]|jgi:hypothetical protein
MKYAISICFIIITSYYINAEYLDYNNNNSQKEIHKFLKQQFDIWRKIGITNEMLKIAFDDLPEEVKKHFYLMRIQIVDNKLYAACAVSNYTCTDPRERPILKAINKILKNYTIPNIDFIITLHDELHHHDNPKYEKIFISVPMFLMSKDSSSIKESKFLLLPDIYMLSEEGNNWLNLMKNIEHHNYKEPWNKKQEKIYWRGSSTGGTYNLNNYHKLPRLTLVMLSKSYPDLIDARFNNLAQFSNDQSGHDLKTVINLLFDNNSFFVNPTYHLKYKYLISIDGNTASWYRIPWILFSNSVLLKQDSSNIQWFYSAIKPYVHYIPLKKDLSDIFEKITWLKNNDKKAQQISINATNFVKENLTPEKIDQHIVLILKEYFTLQKFSLKQPTIPIVSFAE